MFDPARSNESSLHHRMLGFKLAGGASIVDVCRDEISDRGTGFRSELQNDKRLTVQHKSIAFGNILFGGVIGAGVDMASGAAYDYPTVISVLMTPSVAPTGSR
jgi:hypothetical protein